MEGDSVMPPESKSSRNARACDVCRKRKVKCDGGIPPCGPCKSGGADCTFQVSEPKRAPQATRVHVEKLEKRLSQLEEFVGMKTRTEQTEDRGDHVSVREIYVEQSTPGNPKRNHSTVESTQPPIPMAVAQNSRSAGLPADPITDQSRRAGLRPHSGDIGDQNSDKFNKDVSESVMHSLSWNAPTIGRFVGVSSVLSILSVEGLQWLRNSTGSSSLHKNLDKLQFSKFEGLHRLLAFRLSRVNTCDTLPSKEECMVLLRYYFKSSNRIYPLFHERSFMSRFETWYVNKSRACTGWWASINIILAIGCVVRESTGLNDSCKSWSYFATAIASLSDLATQTPGLETVQALLGTVLFLTGTSSAQESLSFLTLAIQQAHKLGLHRESVPKDLANPASEQRRRVFWIAYILDKELSIRFGQPPLQDDDDMDVELPAASPSDGLGMIYANTEDKERLVQLNYFRVITVYMTIQSQVYRRLYSVRAGRQSRSQLLETITDLYEALKSWRRGIPTAFRPGKEITGLDKPWQLYVTILHLAYYSSVEVIHRRNGCSSWANEMLYSSSQPSEAISTPMQFESASLCVDAARQSILMLQSFPASHNKYIWAILHYQIAAFISLFTSIILNPTSFRARGDLSVLADFRRFLAQLIASSGSSRSIPDVLSFCSTFEQIAEDAIDRGENISSKSNILHEDTDNMNIASRQSKRKRSMNSPQHLLYSNSHATMAIESSDLALSNLNSVATSQELDFELTPGALQFISLEEMDKSFGTQAATSNRHQGKDLSVNHSAELSSHILAPWGDNIAEPDIFGFTANEAIEVTQPNAWEGGENETGTLAWASNLYEE